MHTKRKWPLLHQLMLLTAVGLLPLTLISAWGISTVIEEQRQDLARSTHDLSRALASAVDTELEATINALRTLSYGAPLADGKMRDFYDYAQATAQIRPGWSSVVLADGKGNFVFNTSMDFGARGARIVEPASLSKAIQTRAPVVGNLAKGPNNKYAFPVRVPVIRDGQLTHILSAVVTPERVLQIVQRQNVPQSWVIAVFDGNGLRVARSKDHDNTIATPASPSLADLLRDGRMEGSGITRTLEGDESFTGFTKLPQYGWTVAVGVPTSDFRASLVRTFVAYGLGIFVSLAICALLAAFISRRILLDIGGIRDRAVQLGQGKPVSVISSKIREVEEMGQALQLASEERLKIEQDREALVASLENAVNSQREALANAEQAGRAKDQFLAVLGHELRNPLAPIVTALELLEAKADPSSQRERQVMQRQVEHMKRLVDDLLDVSRITSGKLEIRREPAELRAIVERAVEAVAPAVSQHSGKIRLKMPAQPIWLVGDDARLVQVFTNLLANALRFSPAGEVTISAALHEREVRIAVEDRGAGMTAETLENIFTPFYQAPQSLARSRGGLGLGLAIVRSIVELHGGRVSASSDGPGKGSTFEIILPAGAPPQQAESLHAAPRSNRTGKIMVVDDNVDAAQTIVDGMTLAGHDVTVSCHPREALALYKAVRPDLAILDIGLPEMDGYELAKLMRAEAGVASKLIALTGYGLTADRVKSSEAGFDLHMTKPVRLGELLKAVDGLLTEVADREKRPG